MHVDFIVVWTKAKQLAGITFDTRRLSRNLSQAQKEELEFGNSESGIRNKDSRIPEQTTGGRQMNDKHTIHTQ